MIRSIVFGMCLVGALSVMAAEPTRSTAVSIVADKFLINGQPTYSLWSTKATTTITTLKPTTKPAAG